MNPSQLTCPKCGRTDQVQKVTSVYSDNTKEWRETHGSGDDQHTSFHQARTLLGEKLAPPIKPSGPLNPLYWYGLGAFILFVFSVAFCPIVITVPLALIPIFISIIAFFAGADSSLPTWVTYTGLGLGALAILIGIAVVVAVIVGTIWAFRKIRSRYLKDAANYQIAKNKVEAEDLPRWQRGMNRWNNAYYCMRDETVFIAGENQAIPADKLKDYLFDPNYRPL